MKKRSFVRAIVTALLAASTSPEAFAQASAPSASSPPTCAKVDARADVLVVAGTLDGRPVRVFIDTGGSGSVSPALAKGRTPIPGRKERFAGTSGRWVESNLYQIRGLQIGSVEVPPFEATVLPSRPGSSTARAYDLMVGIPELKRFVVEIDLRTNRFCLHASVPDTSTMMYPFELKKDTIVVPSILGQRRLENFIFDTGAGVTTLTEKWLAKIPHQRRNEVVVSVDGSGVRRKQYFVEVARICLFDQCKPKQVVMPDSDLSALNGFPVDGILGMTFFKSFRIVLDLPKSRLAIESI